MANIGYFDVLALLQSYLSESIGVPVSSEYPDEPPEEFITIRRIGGNRKDIRNDTPQVVVRVFSTTEAKAWGLVCHVREAMAKLPTLTPDVIRVKESVCSIQNPKDKSHRAYYLLFFLTTTI